MITEANADVQDYDTREPDLITRAQQGDPDAFGELYRMHHDRVATYISRRVTSNPAIAEDLTADTFIKAWSKIGTFTWRAKSLSAWLTVIARNTIADHYKLSASRRLLFVGSQMTDVSDCWAAPVSSTEDTVLSSFELDHLHQALAGIKKRQQTVLQLRFLGELSVNETARTMGVSEGAIKTLQFRAMANLRDVYKGAAA
ncbi:RNA polymerase sigma factor [Streptomyces anandii]|uniref:RNA polymerase sigma factor n=1 Tax=Streptomyces anandii TaxID=285454 RepID=UPI0037B608BC